MMTTEPASVESLCVLFQSDDYIVVDKHWDIRIDSKMWYETHTLQAQLRHRFPHLADPSTFYGFRFCHQLDFSTSGVLCVALNKAAAGQAYRRFKDRTVTKAYVALIRGWVEKETQTLDFSIGKNTSEGKTHMMCIEGTDGCENAKTCQTELTVLEYGLYDGDPVTKVLLQPLTVEGPLQRRRTPYRRGLHLQLRSRPRPVPHDAARPPPPHPPGPRTPACVCERPLSPIRGPQVAPAAHVTAPEGHR
ncbi:RNA pseudouridylate synthase domain-containing protein 1 isoform X2 [Entelurus aequoreus]|uniref:RNA pseudouridylate synthase domain-containing protein 1 isoform X2 n=1 Tax=Entelurus aequoreus TaxID=161455 RepID=UPI002B1E6865|nr:RNA pseudouridylate synthase domain-containing protein 1 isoform X2 [Entelurus aequoreus]